MATGRDSGEDPRQRLAYLLRRMNVELDQLGQEFAVQHQLHPTDMRALVAIMDAARRPDHEPGPACSGVAPELGLGDCAPGPAGTCRPRSARPGSPRPTPAHTRDRAAGARPGGRVLRAINTALLEAMNQFSEADLEVVGGFLEAMTDVIVANWRARQATGVQALTRWLDTGAAGLRP